MPKPIAKVPTDLREIKTLTLDELERIKALRSQRSRIQTRLEGMDEYVEGLHKALAQTHEDEAAIVDAAKARASAPAPV